MNKVTKVVIPAAGLGTRFLPATKAQPKEMLPVVDRPAIQYVVEEAVRAGLDDILIITGRSKRSLEDHFDRNFELEYHLRAKGKDSELAGVVELADMADIHYVRQGEPLGLGHAVSVARKHVGDEPFVVMLGDDIMVDDSTVLTGMIDAYQQHGSSVVALMEVPHAGNRFLRMCSGRRIRGHVAADHRHRGEAGPGGRAFGPCRDGPLPVHSRHLRPAGEAGTGRGRRAPAHRRDLGPAGRGVRSTATCSPRDAST